MARQGEIKQKRRLHLANEYVAHHGRSQHFFRVFFEK